MNYAARGAMLRRGRHVCVRYMHKEAVLHIFRVYFRGFAHCAVSFFKCPLDKTYFSAIIFIGGYKPL